MINLIYKDVAFYSYMMTYNYKLYEDENEVDIKSRLYHATNGTIYILLKSMSGKPKLYPLDNVIYNSFNPDTQNIYKFFECYHIDGNKENYYIENLILQPCVERWVTVIYPTNVSRDMYEVSSFGNIRNKNTGLLMKTNLDKDGYPKLKLMTPPGNRDCYIRVNRLVALNFINNPDESKYTIVNHINGDKTDNSIYNLEWTSVYLNNQHAKLTCVNYTLDQRKRTALTNDEIDMVIDMLLDTKYSGKSSEIYKDIDHTSHPNIKPKTIQAIKDRAPEFTRHNLKHDLNNIKFERVRKVTSDDIDMIISMLLDPQYDYSITNVYNHIDHYKYPYISTDVIRHIRGKDSYLDHVGLYTLKDVTFNKCTKVHRLNEKID